jgi:hypothetical protein
MRDAISISPSATPEEAAAIYAVLAAADPSAPTPPVERPSAWRAAALREATIPFDTSLGEPR